MVIRWTIHIVSIQLVPQMFIKCWHIDGTMIRRYIKQINRQVTTPALSTIQNSYANMNQNNDINLIGMTFLEITRLISITSSFCENFNFIVKLWNP